MMKVPIATNNFLAPTFYYIWKDQVLNIDVIGFTPSFTPENFPAFTKPVKRSFTLTFKKMLL